MRRLLPAVPALALLLAGACSAPWQAAPTAASPRPTSGAAAGAGGLSQQACKALTASDVRTALGMEVSQLPLTSPPPGGGPDSSLVSGCTYASAAASAAGVSLYLFNDMPIDYFSGVPGFQRVPGVGDEAFMQAPMLIGRKGHVTFQLTIESAAGQAAQEQVLRTLGKAVAGRL